MALVGTITTSDGVEHVDAHALCFPMSIVAVDADMRISTEVHCWHTEANRLAGHAELNGFPASISWTGAEAGQKLVQTLSGLSAITWGADPVANAMAAQAAIVDALEKAVISVDTRFTQVI